MKKKETLVTLNYEIIKKLKIVENFSKKILTNKSKPAEKVSNYIQKTDNKRSLRSNPLINYNETELSKPKINADKIQREVKSNEIVKRKRNND
jgi:hypothetical protein